MNILAPGIYSQHTKKELSAFLAAVDLVLIDLDGCIFPGITGVVMYKKVCYSLLRLGKYSLFGRLLLGSIIISLMKFLQMLHLGLTNKKLILYFTKVIRPVPLSYLEEAVKLIPDRSYAGAKETLEILSKKARVGIISQGLDVVLEEYVRQFHKAKTSFIDFWKGNSLADLLDYQDNPSRRNRFIFNSQDKELLVRKMIEDFQPKKIMVIGHDSGDLGMMAVVKEQRGIVVGFRPIKAAKKMCDIVITGADWTELKQIIQPS